MEVSKTVHPRTVLIRLEQYHYHYQNHHQIHHHHYRDNDVHPGEIRRDRVNNSVEEREKKGEYRIIYISEFLLPTVAINCKVNPTSTEVFVKYIINIGYTRIYRSNVPVPYILLRHLFGQTIVDTTE